MANKLTILCVDDEITVLQSLEQELGFGLGNEFSFEIAQSGEEGLEIIEELAQSGNNIPVIISDQLMPGMKGDQFLIEAHKRLPNTQKIMLTGQASADSVGRALNHAKLYRYIPKPWEEKDLLITVKEAVKSYLTNQQLEAQVKILGDLNISARQLSAEIDPEKLVPLLLTLALQDTGADAGTIVLKDQHEQLSVTCQIVDHKPIFSASLADIPHELINSVIATQETCVLKNAWRIGGWAHLEAISERKVRSIYAAPMSNYGHFVACLYLEKSNTVDYFDTNKQEFLKLLISQGAISLDNALIYKNLENLVAERTALLEQKSKELTETHRDLTDSVHSALRLQRAVMPHKNMLQEVFPESFILNLPRDIVSGDFYWFSGDKNNFMICVADCTGHGVPGAMLSMLGANFLSQIYQLNPFLRPSELLDNLRLAVYQTLNTQGQIVLEGIDISTCLFQVHQQKLFISGTRRPVWVLRNGEIIEVDTNRIQISGNPHDLNNNRFSDLEVFTRSGDCVYMFSDGITDQFGGPRSKKFSRKRLNSLLTAISGLPMNEQRDKIAAELAEWQSSKPQTDDILIIGIRI